MIGPIIEAAAEAIAIEGTPQKDRVATPPKYHWARWFAGVTVSTIFGLILHYVWP